MTDDPYKSSSFIGHSLWLCPSEGPSKDAYSAIIADTASKLDTFSYLPHVTLVAAIMTDVDDVVRRTKELAQDLAPYELELDTLGGRDAYFQCVYARLKQTPTVMQANAKARQVFPERQSDPEYIPHLSLIYGDFTMEEKEKTLIPELKKKLAAQKDATSSFRIDAIEVWSTQGDVKDWYLVETIPLKGENPK
mmetsp:Transcript_12352/g.18984  ORF Transcript_12352/g.18984 Transcript_12352/m.18984 type:complete len:193 (-) Transcript_12352:242-820(-)|eukprot:CAMPEP_0178903284 /NCGR_PEP_ID=MMETSP0786-20121207/5074_1 /TAXON_ID=186022 /ORGANISM="Thalassionema frauenfeldii, Strain CCMP 1798" /LENGTH=192 /DNA_ID=CAMNT_0020574643 /DNA_START=84 /DNA_END=662 /DNA_ORIENTATION=+